MLESRQAPTNPYSRPAVATLLSIALCLPFLLVYVTATTGFEPVERLMATGSGRMSLLGLVTVLGALLSLPAAFAVNLLAMSLRAVYEPRTVFRRTPAHILGGLSALLLTLAIWGGMTAHELRPFVAWMGGAAGLGRLLYLLALLILPATFTLNLFPRFGRSATSRFQPASINLILGGAILLVIFILAGTFMLEGIACSAGVPNCD